MHNLLEQQHNRGDWTPSEDGSAQTKTADKDSGAPPNHDRHTQSRLLTKKQLSDMAFGIRELSKKLGHIKLNLKVKNVFILTKAHDETLIKCSRDLTEWLLNNKSPQDVPYTVWVEETMKDNEVFDAKGLHGDEEERKGRLKFWTNELCAKKPHAFDIAIAVSECSLPCHQMCLTVAARW